jgi:hypothetical protein
MVIVRHVPGDDAPWTGWYALVGHYGESTDYIVWCEAGERLPVLTGAADIGPFWYVLMDVADESTRTA